MQTEEHAKFRLNGQVVIVIGILMIALALPIAMVIVALKPAPKPAPESVAGAAAEPLEKALAEVADKNLGSSDLDYKESRISFSAADPVAAGAQLEKKAAELGGYSLPASPEEKTVRLSVSLPAERVDEFTKACQGKDLQSTIHKEDGETRILITVVISSETP